MSDTYSATGATVYDASGNPFTKCGSAAEAEREAARLNGQRKGTAKRPRREPFREMVRRLEAAALDGDSEALARLGDLAERQAAQRRMLPLRQPERTYALLVEAAGG